MSIDETNVKFRSKPFKPFVKWLGGKSRQLGMIEAYAPDSFNRFIDPFVGGGAVWLGIDPVYHYCHVNDYNDDIINLYETIKGNPSALIKQLHQFNELWKLFADLGQSDRFDTACKIKENLNLETLEQIELYQIGFKTRLIDTIKKQKPSIHKTAEHLMKAGYYYFVRDTVNINQQNNRYNEHLKWRLTAQSLSNIHFIVMRQYGFSGLFRRNKQGQNNVPFGGQSYLNKDLGKQIGLLQDNNYVAQYKAANFARMDFERFMYAVNFRIDDFIFLDPPYDGSFSTYGGKEFNQRDHKRLAGIMKAGVDKTQMMLIIQDTEFVRECYDISGFETIATNYKYIWNVKGRNEQKTTHLIIKNY